MKLNRLIIITILLFTAIFIGPTKTYAHILKSDKSIGAVLHITPEDDPIVGEASGFFFEFKDKQNKFTPQNCDCTFSVLESGKEIYSQPLFQNNEKPSLSNASVFYTFAYQSVYQVKVIGKPVPSGAFEPFILIYDIRVARVSRSENSGPNIKWQFIIFGVIGISIILIILKKVGRK